MKIFFFKTQGQSTKTASQSLTLKPNNDSFSILAPSLIHRLRRSSGIDAVETSSLHVIDTLRRSQLSHH